MQTQNTASSVTGDDSLGLELLEDGGFSIHGMEFRADQSLNGRRVHDTYIERMTQPVSTLTVRKKDSTHRFRFDAGVWFRELQLDVAQTANMADGKLPESKGTAYPKPEVLILEPDSEKFNHQVVQFSVEGNRDGFADELLARYVAHFKAIATPDTYAGRSRFGDKLAPNCVTTFFRVVNEFYYIMHMVKTRFIANGDVCSVEINAYRAWSTEHTKMTFFKSVILRIMAKDKIQGTPAGFDWTSRRMRYAEWLANGPIYYLLCVCSIPVILPLAILDNFGVRWFSIAGNWIHRVAYVNWYLSNYEPKIRLKAAKGCVHSCSEMHWIRGSSGASFQALWRDERGRWNHHRCVDPSAEEIAEISRMLDLAKIAFFRACTDMHLKANTVKGG